MEKRKVVILGGGISGLATRFFLSELAPSLEITLIEKKEKLGGVISEKRKGAVRWDLGPKTFSLARTPMLNTLIDDLDLSELRVFSNKNARYRYLVKDDTLTPLPSRVTDFIFKKAYRQWLPSLLSEWRKPTFEGDESIWDFANRRFGFDFASNVFDPMTLGIYAGDVKKLSISACFPQLKEKEMQWGSLSKAMFFDKKKKKSKKGLFTLKGGMMELIDALENQGKGLIVRGEEVKQVLQEKDKWSLLGDKTYHADHIISALPLDQMTHLFGSIEPEVKTFAQKTPSLDISFATLFFSSDIFIKKGFGCIFPTRERSDFLGIIFDSCLYPDPSGYFKCTVLMKKPLKSEVIIEKIQTLLKTRERPVLSDRLVYNKALPQFFVHHKNRVDALETSLAKTAPTLTLTGNYLHGVSVEACVKRAYQSALMLSQ